MLKSLATKAMFAAGAATVVFSSQGQAQAIGFAPPTGLNSGDQFRLVFVTESGTSATSDDITTYNSFVDTAAANSAGLNAFLQSLGLTDPAALTWKAIVSVSDSPSGSDISAITNTNTDPDETGFSIFRVDGTKVADNNDDLWDGTIDNPINVTENGGPVPGGIGVWTGTDANGSGAFPSVGLLGNSRPQFGRPDLTNDDWTDFSQNNPNVGFRLYGISDPITFSGATPVPTPALLPGLIGMGVAALRKRKGEADKAEA